ncbi:MAG: sigma-70 family RNA polymerase sigma factor [Fusobacteriaceae bacterium]
MKKFNLKKNYPTDSSSDSISLYLKEISEIPLLTSEEEKYYSKLAFEKDSFAQNMLVQSNLKLVTSIAKKYYCSSHFSDIIQEGNLGLIRATKKFDYNLGWKFSTYATYWINESILKYLIYKKRLIYIPQHTYHFMNKIKKFISQYREANKNYPSIEIISQSLKISYHNVVLALIAEKNSLSFYKFFSQENEFLFEKFLACNNYNPEIILEKKHLNNSLNKILLSLDSREQTILIKNFGLHQNKPENFAKISRSLKLSPERIRQIQKSALIKLKKISDEDPDFF